MVTPDLIREARLRAGLSQQQLAQRLGLHPTAISRWERGEVLPSLETVRDVVRSCDLELGFRLGSADQTGHETALIRESLRRTPVERLRENVAAVNSFARMSAHAAEHRSG